MPRPLVLASSSPRRHQLLRSIGLEFDVDPADVDESVLPGEHPIDYVTRVAAAKALTIGEVRRAHGTDVVVLAADTTVEVGGEILGKPVDDLDARRMLRSLSGTTHHVHTAVVTWVDGRDQGTPVSSVVVSTDVTFARLSEQGIDWYLSFGEHRDKAGAYGMQGTGGALVHHISGSASNVIGLPLAETIGMLRAAGVAVAGGRDGVAADACES